MSWYAPQNPGLDGIDELTDAEEAFITNLAGLPYVTGDILYHDGSDLINLGIGNTNEALTVSGGIPAWQDLYVQIAGDTMTGALTIADLSNAINSADYPIQMESGVADGAGAMGYIFDTTNDLATAGAKILEIKNAGTDLFHIEKAGAALHGHMSLGESASIDPFSIMNIAGTSQLLFATPSGQGAVNIESTINVVGAIRQAAAFSGKATVTGSGVLPFISGMLFQVDQQGTGTWGANPGTWGQAPTVIGARFTSQAGSQNLGNWASVFNAGSPSFAGGAATITYIGFEAGSGSFTASSLYGMYIWPQTSSTGVATGIYVGAITGDTNSRGIVLDKDGAGGDLVLGDGQDVSFRYGGTNTELVNLVGTGLFDVQMGLKTGAGRIKNTTRVTTTYTILVTDEIIFANTDGGAYTVTLPALVEGQTFKIINSSSSLNNLTVAPDGSDDLLGENSSFDLYDGETLLITGNATDGWY